METWKHAKDSRCETGSIQCHALSPNISSSQPGVLQPLVETSEVSNPNAKHASIGYVAHVISFVGRRSASGMPGNGAGNEVVRGWPGVCNPNKRG